MSQFVVDVEYMRFIGTSLILADGCPFIMTLTGNLSTIVDECLDMCEVRLVHPL